ncbi:MAG: protein kinase, partial [Myxococcaceae bacterium]|nr:protein kinase [Myxococcaceae bacterium]
MAELYLAFLPGPSGFKKFVAVKQILPDVKRDEAFVKMFLDEARITAAFSHANIGQVFDLGEDAGELYLAMEFISGQNLEQLLKRAARREVPIPVGLAARVVRDTALALHYAHQFTDPSTGQAMPVVHRDISPKNVMITYSGDVKVIDFGIAKAKGRLNRTQVGVVKGTSGYMAPEQVKNEALDGRSDLFAAAVMLHEMLCGERLFTAPSDAGMMIKIVEFDAPPPTQVNPYVSEAFSAVVLKGLEKSRDRRFATGKEFARAIEQACPEMFEEEQVAEFMQQLFEDKIALTRSVLELANEAQDVSSLSRAIEGLKQEESEQGSSGGRKKATDGAGVRSTATPAPRQGLPRSSASSQRLPKVKSGSSSQRLSPVGSGPRSARSLPKVSDSRRAVDPVEAPDDEQTEKRSSRRLAPVADAKGPPAPRAKTAAAPAEPVRAAEQTLPPEGGGARGLALAAGVVVLLGLIGAGGWVVTKGSPAAPEEPAQAVDTGPTPIAVAPEAAAPSEVPQWLLEKQEQQRREAEEKARQKEVEEAANDPERLQLLQEIMAQIQQLDRLEEEHRQLKIAANESKSNTEQNSKKIEELQKQINDLKGALAEKESRKKTAGARRGGAPGEVQVVRDSRSAKAAAVGFLTLRTVNPASANVFLDGEPLGATPLVKQPIDTGTHALLVIDGDSKGRTLSVTIAAGKTEELRVDVGSLPLAP